MRSSTIQSRSRRRALSWEEAAEIKNFIMSLPPLPVDEAGRWASKFEAAGYREVSVRKIDPCLWRIKARLPEDRPFLTDADAKRDARRVVRGMGRKLLSPGVGAQVGRQSVAFAILLQPADGRWPRPEDFLPERFRQGPRDELENHL